MKDAINSMSRFCLNSSLGLLLIRAAAGLLFLAHGWMKVKGLEVMMGGVPQTVAMFAHMGFPGWVAYFIAWLEVIGGAALILGILTRLFAVAFGIEMLVAVFIAPLSHAIGGVELLLALASFGIALTGSGRYALFSMECRDCGGMLCKPGSDACPVDRKS